MKRAIIAGTVIVALLIAAGLWLWHPSTATNADAEIVLPLRTFALNLDPATMSETESRKVATLLYTGLVAVDQDGAVRPRLATAWRRTAPDTMTFELRSGVTFPDGSPVTSAEVVASLCASMQPSHVQAWSLDSIAREPNGPEAVACTGLTAPNATTVTIRETAPTPWLLEALAGPGGWIVDVRKPLTPYGVRPGVGPYTVERITPDQAVVLRARTGGAIDAHAQTVTFQHLPDGAVAANLYNSGRLDLLEIDTPQLVELLLSSEDALRRTDGRLQRYESDRVRVVAINLAGLSAKGFGPEALRAFISQYDTSVDRSRIATRLRGLARPMHTGFPPDERRPVPYGGSPQRANQSSLTLLTENDPFSDLVGSLLPSRVGSTTIRYEAIDKSLLIDALVGGTYDLALIRVEATHHTPRFWSAFFTPGNPYTAFGVPVEGVEDIDLATPLGVAEAGALINREGNWVGVFRELGLYAASSRLTGVRLTPSGQWSLEEIGRAK